MKERIILIGGGGHCKSCIDVIEQAGAYQIVGIVDNKREQDCEILGYKIIGTDDDLPKLVYEYKNAMITIGQIKNSQKRIEIFETLKGLVANLPVIISPLAYVSEHARIAEGTIVMHHALINADARIGRNCVINSKALIEHDAIIEDFVNIAPGADVSGNVLIEKGAYVGANATILQGESIQKKMVIGEYSTVGAGAVVTRNVDANSTVVGMPARSINKHLNQ
jgi:sugar O-acyltransferase (sialic acid O-acetyltransferase NeuD family)